MSHHPEPPKKKTALFAGNRVVGRWNVVFILAKERGPC